MTEDSKISDRGPGAAAETEAAGTEDFPSPHAERPGYGYTGKFPTPAEDQADDQADDAEDPEDGQ